MRSTRILIAPGPYKECLDSRRVAEAMERGVKEILPEAQTVIRPLCDGGTGIARILVEASGGSMKEVNVYDPTGAPLAAEYGLLGDGETAIVESATAAGLSIVPKDKRNPLKTSTFGVGQLIAHAANAGARRIIIGCGDSGTNDCGIGCAAAIGARFYSRGSSRPLEMPVGGDLCDLDRIDLTEVPLIYKGIEFLVACNLTSILCGPDGTSRVYGPQKGATPDQVELLQQGVDHFVQLVYENWNRDLSFIPGAGGSGGLAASLYGFFGAKLLYSIDVVDRYLKLDEHLSNTDLVLTGEGRIDDRTATGKAPCGLALKAKRYNLPVIAIVGGIAEDHEDIFYNGIDAVESIAEGPSDLETLTLNAERLIERATTRVMRFAFRLFCSKG